MAGDAFGKIQSKFSSVLEKTKGSTDKNAAQKEEKVSLGSAKNQRNSLMQDKQKYLCYLGMAAYNLYREGKLEHEELQGDFGKLEEIDGQLDELDKTIEKLEKMKAPKNVCECGAKLSKNDQFCPNCGKKVKDVIVCNCGAKLSSDAKFCNHCGASVAELKGRETAGSGKTCICGAAIAVGQAMCMECGRMVE